MKGYIRIGGAVLCGVAVIAIAFYARTQGTSAENGAVVVLDAPERQYIETLDTDQNGTPDWEDELNANVIESVSASTTLFDTSEPYTPPTTLTGKFSEAFMKDYLYRKGSGDTFEDPTEFVNSAVASIEGSTLSKHYSRFEIQTIPDSAVAIREYGNRIAEVALSQGVTGKNETVIFMEALEKGDPSLLEPLEARERGYTALISETLAVPVPESLVEQHLALLNAYEAIRADIHAMREAFNDPILAIARLQYYDKDVAAFLSAFKELSRVLTGFGVTYAHDEAGALLYRSSI